MIVKTLFIGIVAWPLLIAVAPWRRAHGADWPAVTYLAGSVVCHQRATRSFHTTGVPWPVCARCSGLYFAAPLGAIAALLSQGRWGADRRAVLRLLAIAAVPTMLTLVLEWSGMAMTNALRFVAALPLGAAIAAVLIRTASRQRLD